MHQIPDKKRTHIYGTWEEIFQFLYSFKAKTELRSSGSVFEIDTNNFIGEVYFNNSLLHSKLVLMDF